MSVKAEPFFPNQMYHIFHQGNSGESIFRSADNFQYFLTKYSQYIFPVAETFAYCLMPNHFHFAVKFRSEEIIREFISQRFLTIHPNGTPPELKTPEKFATALSKLFSDFLNGYSQAFNKQHKRKGRLFSESIQRKKIDNLTYLKNLILYIHLNPVHHGFCKSPEEWIYSSFQSIISKKQSRIEKKKVFELFQDANQFKRYHHGKIDMSYFLEIGF